MTNFLAVLLAVAILTGLVLDHLLGTGVALGLARRFVDMVHYLSFWR